ncbi:MAG: penicillin-binding protein 2 [Candidatus Omnitrophica bacterium]|nr:penicillin-binding protein 2 [Candidatus Omnitrophota bacterium]MDE2214522.1 penicillin-binding protein 2 [Candidatus Omnitrophota bacterium]MDE2230840.1 penicillin-binding protein 2 [Candidatus Omnitrophota bacterium]
MRLNIIQSVVFFLLGAIICSLFYMQIIHGAYWRRQSTNNRIRIVPVDGPRGRILDRHGTVLADDRVAFEVGVIPQDIEDQGALFGYLGSVLHQDPQSLERRFGREKQAPFAPVILAEDVPRQLAIKIEEEKFVYPGLIVQQGFERYYPFHDIGAHVLGYVGKISKDEIAENHSYGYTPLSRVGKTGIEEEYEPFLKGHPGGRQIEVNSRGRQVRLLGLKDPSAGNDVVLTVDARLQAAAQELLSGQRGGIVVMNLNTGELLSLVSSPSYDPNVFLDKTRSGELRSYLNDPLTPLFDRVTCGLYPPGSVFKVPEALAAIQLHKITPQTTFFCPGYMLVGKRKFHCAEVHGVQDLQEAIAHSCNVYFFHVGLLLQPHLIGAFEKAFGLTRPTGIDLPYEARGHMVTKASRGRPWYTGDVLNLSIGQGYTLVTPLELTVMMAAVADDGIVLQPRLVRQIGGRLLIPEDLSKRPLIKLRKQTWQIVQQGLRACIDDPTGTCRDLAAVPGLDIYGKTGTAQTVYGKPNDAWFVGYTRSAKAGIAICVFLEYGGSSENAVKIARDLLLKLQSLKVI